MAYHDQGCSGAEATAINNWSAWKYDPSEPEKPTYHQTIEPILEAETSVYGCIKNEDLRFIVNQTLMERLHRWSDGPTHKMKDTVLYWTSLE